MKAKVTTLLSRLVWALALGALGFGIATGDRLLVLGAGGAVAMALLPVVYTWLSGILVPAGLRDGILVFCLAAFVGGEWGGLYQDDLVWDTSLHILAAAVLALTGYALALLPTAGAPPRTSLWVLSVLAVGLASTVGAAWELFEATVDALFGTNAQRSGLPDTMGDMAANLAGAIYGAMVGQLALRGRWRLPLSGLLLTALRQNPVVFGAYPGTPFPRHTARPKPAGWTGGRTS
ncbi:hypothetical protein SAMN04488020_103120 [Palleronia marisminoris]|uniref:Inner membrane protein YjdF n=1 Tax=Palleronia marisminoris TaxID=315423 RepID=A0A1Y5S976_9RHOB|nr:hypothetical protein [Palleronia marisminoris]SFG66076.1 hypothetical protein SAMN04488020_103120 [Palleronia marisminoris]SLN33913.1 hypothetical protein PAM7066_01400 [Palleronia marisminoris]